MCQEADAKPVTDDRPTAYNATRAHLAALTAIVQSGDQLRTDNGQTYIVTDALSALGGRMVRHADAPAGPGTLTLAQLLACAGTLHTQP